jgi:hypothetical protein
MANYLERVASSAGRRAAGAKPPVSGPPVLPAGRDFSITPADPLASDEEQFVESLETLAPARTGKRAEIPSTQKIDAAEESRTPATPDATVATPVEPEPKPRTSVERLSSESPFTVRLPRTLRPSATPPVMPTTADEPPRERPRVRASTTVGPEEITIGEQPVPRVRSGDSDVSRTEEPTEADTPARPTPRVTAHVGEQQAPVPVHTEATLSGITPIPRVDHVDGPVRHSTEPSPPPALPVQLPPAVNNSARQEQSRISIGSLEVLVNNHPRVPTVRPASVPSRSERLNLEKRYLDRFRLRH